MSPFTYANAIKDPLLLIHGMADDNTGTFPIQSERLYAAIQGNGGTARLVMLPYEAHGYVGRETVETVLAEMTDWLNRWLGPGRTARAEPQLKHSGSAGALANPSAGKCAQRPHRRLRYARCVQHLSINRAPRGRAFRGVGDPSLRVSA